MGQLVERLGQSNLIQDLKVSRDGLCRPGSPSRKSACASSRVTDTPFRGEEEREENTARPAAHDAAPGGMTFLDGLPVGRHRTITWSPASIRVFLLHFLSILRGPISIQGSFPKRQMAGTKGSQKS